MRRRRLPGAAPVCALAVVLIAATTTAAAGRSQGTDPEADTTEVTVTEGTNLAVAAAPGNSPFVLDLQGQLFSLPREGGTATPIADKPLDPFRPVMSPDGRRVAVQSFVDGMFHIRIVGVDGHDSRQLTFGDHDDVHPAWSPDGTRIAFVSDRAGGQDIWTVDMRGGEPRRVTTTPTQETQPTWSPDGRAIAYVQGNTVESVDLETGTVRTVIPTAGASFVTAPSWSPDGRRIAFVRGDRSGGTLSVAEIETGAIRRVGGYDDVFPFPAQWLSADELAYGANGRLAVSRLGTGRDGTTTAGAGADRSAGADRTVPFSATFRLKRPHYPPKKHDFDSRAPRTVRGIVGPALSPDGRSVVFKALNDLWLLPIGGRPRRLTRDAFYEVDPAWSRDGTRIAYASDKAGTEDLYVLDLADGRESRVTSLPGTEFAPAWSPDGHTLAFQDEVYRTLTVDTTTGAVTPVLGPALPNVPGRPSWSADGRTLALTVNDAERNRIMLADVASGATRIVDPAPLGSITTRGDDGPVWSPDGRRLAFTMDGAIHVLPVDPAGNPTGPARRVTRDGGDAPSWSGDSQTLLYLHNGTLRTTTLDAGTAAPADAAEAEGRTRNIPVQLTYTRDRPDTRMVIHAGRLWDGRSPDVRTDVDIVVVGNRIRAVEPHRAHRPGKDWRFVDASTLTVTPGLTDMHNHQEMRSKSFGDRQGRLLLSYGITTTRSTGDPAYRALEDRESLDSGARLGPRFFATGEMLEGTRFNWEFARPVRDERQLDLELSRVRALDYDLVKTYERFRVDWQARVTEQAHRLGIPTTSHYLYPAVGIGVDMKEHLAAPSKWGFAFARESSLGNAYEDVFKLEAAGGMPVSSTLFSSGSLLADDPGIEQDPRVRALYPAQERRALHAKVLCALGQGPCGFLDGTPEQARRDVGVAKRLIAAGGTVLAGTDAPLDSTAVALHLNLRAMVTYGMTPFQALQSATLLPAQQLGVADDLGSVEPGKLADLVITGGDPSHDIAALADVRMVVKNGEVHTPEDLIRPFAEPARP